MALPDKRFEPHRWLLIHRDVLMLRMTGGPSGPAGIERCASELRIADYLLTLTDAELEQNPIWQMWIRVDRGLYECLGARAEDSMFFHIVTPGKDS